MRMSSILREAAYQNHWDPLNHTNVQASPTRDVHLTSLVWGLGRVCSRSPCNCNVQPGLSTTRAGWSLRHFFSRLNLELPLISNPIPRYMHKKVESRCSNETLDTDVHSNSMHSSQEENNPKVQLIDEGINKLGYPYSAILFSYKKEWNTDTCYNMATPQNHYAK